MVQVFFVAKIEGEGSLSLLRKTDGWMDGWMERKEGMGKVKRKRMNSVMAFGFLHCICIIISSTVAIF
jgi:hypothetical protein